MRNLTKTLVAVSLLTSTSVHSLGIGGIKLRSALNQKLNAEIALVTSSGEGVSDIRVKLASPSKFDEAGVPWSYFLTKIKFTPVTKPDGSVVVKLTSDEALKEPYLDFLLEVSGPSGTLFREFTVLVDPPATYKQPVVQVTQSRPPRHSDYNDQSMQSRVTVPSYSQRPPVLEQDDSNSVNEFGPTRKSDTIWSIANAVKPDDVSAAQMVMAIYEANPQAFSRPNVNALLAGSMLVIPDRDAVLQISQQQAFAEFKQQGNQWRGAGSKRKAPARKVKHKPLVTKVEAITNEDVKQKEPEKQLKLEPPLESDVSDGDSLATNGEQKVNNASSDSQTEAATNVTKGATNHVDADLKKRFEHIEQQLLMMQKMLELKDAQLAALQQKQATVNKLIDLTPPKEFQPETVPAPPALITPVEPPPIDQPKQAASASVDNSALAIAEPEPMVVEKPLNKVQPNQPVAPSPVAEPAAADVFADYYWLAGGVGACLLGALGLIWWRKRKVDEAIDTESMFASASQISLPDSNNNVVQTNQTSGYEVGSVAESAFLSEFTPSEFDAFETDQTEIDPMSEADVYLAYGRYQQAEELIRQVILDHPHRNDCKLKLLEIYHASGNKPEFNQFVRQLINEGKQSDKGFWHKVVEMAEEFTPGSGALISLSEDASPVKDNKPNHAVSDVSQDTDIDIDLDSLSLSTPKTISIAKASTALQSELIQDKHSHTKITDKEGDQAIARVDNQPAELDEVDSATDALDFDFSSLESPSFAAEEASLEFMDEAETDEGLDFDLNAFASENTSSDDEQIEFINEDDGNSIEFDLNAFSLEKTEPEEISFVDVSSTEMESNGLEFNLDSFDKGLSLNDELNLTGDSEFSLSDAETDVDLALHSSLTAAPDDLSLNAVSDFEFDFELDDETPLSEAFKSESADLSLTDDLDDSISDFDFSTDGLSLKSEHLDSESDEEFNFDFDFSSPSKAASSSIVDSLGTSEVSDLTDNYSAFETKVNLANAYVDMGDIEAARVIADDLLAGTPEQKKAGQEILEKIS